MDTVATVPLRDLLSRQGRRDPYPFYAMLHRNGPVCRLDDRFDLVVHGFDAVGTVLRDTNFRVMDGEYPDRRGVAWAGHPALRTLTTSIFFTDGPDHRYLRRLIGHGFTSRRIAALEREIGRVTERLFDRLGALGAGGEPVDFMAEFALALPTHIIGELLGVPEQDRSWFPPRVRAIGEILDLGDVWRFLRAADEAAVELTNYFAELVERRRAAPRDDLVSALVGAQASGAPLEDGELLANLITIFNAGLVTTTHLIGNGLTLLLERPDLAALLRAEPRRAPAYVEEILRYAPPTHFSIRWAVEDTELAGVPVPAGSRVLVLLAAANRDPNQFAEPDVFDPTRTDNQTQSFGGGPHYCLGAALSRLEGRLALPVALRRFPNIAIAAAPTGCDKFMLRGYDRLPVTLT